MRARLIVWTAGTLLALSIASYLSARIALLNRTISVIDGDQEVAWTGNAPEIPSDILSWINLSLLAIPICLALYLASLLWYFLQKKNTDSATLDALSGQDGKTS